MATIYLDVDDEITSAAARIRESKDLRIALVLPSGSRIATSRINFKLLQREARERSRRLSIVTPEASARALAASAGLAVFASVRDYDEHLADLELGLVPGAATDDGEAAAPGPGVAPGAAAALGAAGPADADSEGRTRREPESEPGRGIAQARPLSPAELAARDKAGAAPERGADRVRDGAPARGGLGREREAAAHAPGPSTGLRASPASVRRSDGRRLRLVVALVVALFLLAAAGAAAYVVLPTARIVLTLRTVPVGPLELIVHADPEATTPDATELIVPAIRLDLPLSATGTFPATGKRTDEKPATGTLQWTNCDPTRPYTIPKGTLARTQAGIGFTTDAAIFLPVAILTGNPPTLRITCQARTVTATAVKAGLSGNVAALAVNVVPGSYNSVVITVKNPNQMAGGTHKDFPKVVQKDVDGALAALTGQLDEQLKSAAAAPSGLPPGATVFPATATRGQAQPGVDPASLVGTEVQAFDLSVTAAGTVVAVDPSPLEGIGAARLAAEVPPGHDVVAGSTSVTAGPGTVADGIVSFAISAREESVPRVDATALRDQLKGKTAADVRAQLGALGDVAVTLWPDWVSTVTGFDARLDVTVTGPSTQPAASPEPSASASPSGAAGGSAAPSASSGQGSPEPSAAPSASGAPEASPSASPAGSGAAP